MWSTLVHDCTKGSIYKKFSFYHRKKKHWKEKYKSFILPQDMLQDPSVIAREAFSVFQVGVMMREPTSTHLTDVDGHVLFLVGPVAQSQPQLLMAAESTQFHFLHSYENTKDWKETNQRGVFELYEPRDGCRLVGLQNADCGCFKCTCINTEETMSCDIINQYRERLSLHVVNRCDLMEVSARRRAAHPEGCRVLNISVVWWIHMVDEHRILNKSFCAVLLALASMTKATEKSQTCVAVCGLSQSALTREHYTGPSKPTTSFQGQQLFGLRGKVLLKAGHFLVFHSLHLP